MTDTIYTITPDGNILWYQYQNPELPNISAWTYGSATMIGQHGWDKFHNVFADKNGHIYAITPDGNLLWYQYQNPELPNISAWANGSATMIGQHGWDKFHNVFAGNNGVIYAITPDGNLLWYQYQNPELPNMSAWANGSATMIGQHGWDKFHKVFAGKDGHIYAITPDGNLLWYQYQNPEPPNMSAWANGSATMIGQHGWDKFLNVLAQ